MAFPQTETIILRLKLKLNTITTSTAAISSATKFPNFLFNNSLLHQKNNPQNNLNQTKTLINPYSLLSLSSFFCKISINLVNFSPVSQCRIQWLVQSVETFHWAPMLMIITLWVGKFQFLFNCQCNLIEVYNTVWLNTLVLFVLIFLGIL